MVCPFALSATTRPRSSPLLAVQLAPPSLVKATSPASPVAMPLSPVKRKARTFGRPSGVVVPLS